MGGVPRVIGQKIQAPDAFASYTREGVCIYRREPRSQKIAGLRIFACGQHIRAETVQIRRAVAAEPPIKLPHQRRCLISERGIADSHSDTSRPGRGGKMTTNVLRPGIAYENEALSLN